MAKRMDILQWWQEALHAWCQQQHHAIPHEGNWKNQKHHRSRDNNWSMKGFIKTDAPLLVDPLGRVYANDSFFL